MKRTFSSEHVCFFLFSFSESMERRADLTFLPRTVAFLRGPRARGARKKWRNILPRWQLGPASGRRAAGRRRAFPRGGEGPARASRGAPCTASMGL